MKKLAFVAFAALCSFSVMAKVSTFTCKLEKFPRASITFKMENLGKPGMTFLNQVPDDDYSPVFTTKSRNETIVRLVSTLNGQGGDLRIGNDRIRFFGDDSGIEFAYFDLFKNSGYKNGFVRMEFDFGTDKQYSKVRCSIK